MIKKKRKKISSLELEFSNLLDRLQLTSQKQYYIGNYPVDFYIKKYRLSIQIDGCFFHFCPKCYKKVLYPRQLFQRRRDKACNMFHKFNKYNLIRFKECYIKDNVEKIPNILYDIFNRIQAGELIFEEYIK